MHLHLEHFDGPLDLLLHLIKAQEINIFNIPIATITEQYLNFIKQIDDVDYYKIGEYLSLAAQLIEIKANILLPILQNKLSTTDAKSLDELSDEDPRKPLVEQLLEYEALKQAADELHRMSQLGLDVFPSGEFKRRKEEFEAFEHPVKGNVFDLLISLEKVLLKLAAEKAAPRVKVQAQKITIQHKMIEIKKRLEEKEEILFKDFMVKCLSRYELIVLLMGLLEMCKIGHVNLVQYEERGEMRIQRGEKFFEVDTAYESLDLDS